MKVNKIRVLKYKLKLKLICNIWVFLYFVNYYWQFIQSFSLILKIIKLSYVPTFQKNNFSMLVFKKYNNNHENIVFNIISEKPAKKLEKLKNLAKSDKKPSKWGNLSKLILKKPDQTF